MLRILILSTALILSLFLFCSCPNLITEDGLKHLKDYQAPDIVITSPDDGSVYGSNVFIEGKITDSSYEAGDLLGKVSTVTYEVLYTKISGEVLLNLDNTFTIFFLCENLSGDLEIKIRATDWNNNSTEKIFKLTDDGTGPVITIDSPEDRSKYSLLVSVEGNICNSSLEPDKVNAVKTFGYEVLGTSIQQDIVYAGNGDFSFDFNTSGLSEDLYVRLTAEDFNGNVSIRTLTLVNEKQGPYISITSPADNSYYSQSVNVSGIVRNSLTDTGIEKVKELSYTVLSSSISDTVVFEPDGSFNFSFSTSILTGNQTLEVTAVDWNNNRTNEYITLVDGGSDIASLEVVPGNQQATLSWDPVPNTEQYDLYYTDNGSIPSDIVGTKIENVSSGIVLSDLKNGALHVFQLKTIPVSGFPANESDYIKVIPLSEHTLAPIVSPGKEELKVSWNSIPGTDEFEVFKGLSESGPFYNISGPISDREFIDTDVAEDSWYFYKVAPSSYGGIQSDYSGGITDPFCFYNPVIKNTFNAGGTVNNIIIEGNYAYLAAGAADLVILDISDVSNPIITGSYSNSYSTREIAVSGDYAYLVQDTGSYNAVMTIVNISNKSNPVLEGTWTKSGYNVWHVDINGNFAYVTSNTPSDQWLEIVDISNPAAPSQFTTFQIMGTATCIDVDGQYAYIPSYGGGNRIEIVDLQDVNNPAPVQAGIFNGGTITIYGVKVVGNTAYAAWYSNGLAVIDVTVKSAPVQSGAYNTSGFSKGVEINGDLLYLSDDNAGVHIIDISTPDTPVLLTSCNTPGAAVDSAPFGNYLLVADSNSILQILDFSRPNSPSSVKTRDTYDAGETDVSGKFAVIADGSAGFKVYNVSDPENVTSAGSINTDGMSRGIDIRGRFVFVCDDYEGMHIYELSSAGVPSYKGTAAASGSVKAYIKGNYAYIAAKTSGFLIADFSDVTAPSIVGSCPTNGYAYGVDIVGDYAYVSSYNGTHALCGLDIIDISDPTDPYLTDTYLTPGQPMDVKVRNNYAYLADLDNGVEILNISDPYNIQAGGTISTPGNPYGLDIIGDFLYLADRSSGTPDFRIYDLKDETDPDFVAAYTTPGYGVNVRTAGNYSYFADGGSGFHIFRLSQ